MNQIKKGDEENMSNEFLLKKSIKLAFQESGEGTKTIIAVHGLTGNHKSFYHYRRLLEVDYHFISYDLRGRGDSSPAGDDTSISQHAEDLKQFIALNNIERPILMGYSMGAYICASVASEINVSGLILLDGAGTTVEKQRKQILPSLSRLKKVYCSVDDYVMQTKAIYDSLNVEWNPAVEETTRYEVHQTSVGWQHKSHADVMEEDFNSFYDFKPELIFKDIGCPILLVIALGRLGQNDPLFTTETYTKTIASARDMKVIEVPANHYTLIFEQQEEVEKNILALLNKIKRRSV